jgi:hypothetical protein
MMATKKEKVIDVTPLEAEEKAAAPVKEAVPEKKVKGEALQRQYEKASLKKNNPRNLTPLHLSCMDLCFWEQGCSFWALFCWWVSCLVFVSNRSRGHSSLLFPVV